jgi:ABC-type multidrug transport system ATPase subunit
MSLVLYADCIGKRYGLRSVLTAASLRAHSGRITALLGRNGAGKSTLLKISAGWMRADHGRVSYLGAAIERPRLHRLARLGLCYLPSETGLFSSTIPLGLQLEAIARRRSPQMLSEVIDTLELSRVLAQAPRTLSGGEQRRASLATSWLLQPRCLLADEPLRGIDPIDQERLMAVFQRMAVAGTALVITGHQADMLLDAVDEVVWTTDGTTHHLGSPPAARANWQFSREFLGTRAEGSAPRADIQGTEVQDDAARPNNALQGTKGAP